MADSYKKILVINTFGIGDVLFTSPLVRTLKRCMPESSIDFLCNERTQCIFMHNKAIDDIILFEKDDFRNALKISKLYFIKKLWGLIMGLKKKRYDLAIDLSLGYHVALMLKMIGVKKRIGFNYRERGRFLTGKVTLNGFDDKHVVDYYLDILRLIGIDDFYGSGLDLIIPEELDRWASEFIERHKISSRRLVGLVPGSGKSWGPHADYRRWAVDNFIKVAKSLHDDEDSLFFLVFGSDEEGFLGKRIEAALPEITINLSGKLPLLKSAALIRRCEIVLCNEGGVLHVATSQNVKTVSIFGPVDDFVYGPYPRNEKNKVIVAEGISCRPCYKNFRQRQCQTRQCLKDISCDKVIRVMEASLGI